LIAVAIRFIGPDVAFATVDIQRCLNLIRESPGIPRQGLIAQCGIRDLRQLTQRSNCKQVRRNEERENAGVIRRPESGMNQPTRLRRIAKAGLRQRIAGILGHPLKGIRPAIL
jgi:hypothetical protein